MEKERCLLVAVQLPGEEENDMEELEQLVEAAGGEVISSIVQNKQSIDNRFYAGQGKIEEIANYVKELDIDTVIFNDELSGSQIRNIEEIVEAKVIDRTNLILDIFAKRALTKEGQLQVELAQLKYSLPRLIGVNKNLSRLGGGIGTRGPGEQKLEIDRRRIKEKITDIQNQLEVLEKVRETKRKKRMKDQVPIVSIVGYTNAGKSTLLNALMDNEYREEGENKKVFAHDMLFATLDTELRRVRLPGGRSAVFSDTVGFIKKLPTQIVEAFKGTLEEIKYADLIIHLIDINDENLSAHKETTIELIEKITGSEIPILTVYNKVDKILNEKVSVLNNGIIYISAKYKYNIQELLEAVDNKINGPKNFYILKIPNDNIKIYYWLYENRVTENVEFDGDGVSLRVLLYENEKDKYKDFMGEKMSNYKSIHKEGRDEIIINKSRFIGTACPVETEEEALEFIDKIKKEFKDATHNVYAYVIGENSNIQRFSDDGEPSGTAGMPVLNVIKQENIKNAAVVVTRYFGGVLLGAGGLVRAYTKSSKIALESGIIVDKKLFYDVLFKLDYTLLGKMDNELLKNNVIVKDKVYEEQVLFKLIVEKEDLDKINALVGEISSGKAEISVGQAKYYSTKNGKIVD